jgi:hypothetical protein
MTRAHWKLLQVDGEHLCPVKGTFVHDLSIASTGEQSPTSAAFSSNVAASQKDGSQLPFARTPSTHVDAVQKYPEFGVLAHETPGRSSDEQSPNPPAFASRVEASQMASQLPVLRAPPTHVDAVHTYPGIGAFVQASPDTSSDEQSPKSLAFASSPDALHDGGTRTVPQEGREAYGTRE